VQTLLGHSKITTAERYLHARPLAELAERMDAIFAVAIEAGTGTTASEERI
jgi:site-specific recombinase XerD